MHDDHLFLKMQKESQLDALFKEMKRLTLSQEKFQKQLLSAFILYGMVCFNSSVESILFPT
jgi:hypothetical protein